MPFFLKCMRFRKKNKKSRKAIKKCIQTYNDVTTIVTPDEILENSDASVSNETESADVNNNEPVSASLNLRSNLTSFSDTTDERNENLSPPDINEDECNQDVINDELSSESLDDTINDRNQNISNLTMEQGELNTDRDRMSASHEDEEHLNNFAENLPNEINNDDTDKIVIVKKCSTEIVKDDTCLKSVASIVNKITVTSNVFEIIEKIQKIESAESQKYQIEENDECIEEEPVEMKEIRAILHEIIDKLDNLQNSSKVNEVSIESNAPPGDYNILKHSLENVNESTNTDLTQNTLNVIYQGDQLYKENLDVCISEMDSVKLEYTEETTNHENDDAANTSELKEAAIVDNKKAQNSAETPGKHSGRESTIKTEIQLNSEANNSVGEIPADKTSNELNLKTLLNIVTESSEKLHYKGDGIERTSDIEIHQKCAQENEINENVHQINESISNSPNRIISTENTICPKTAKIPLIRNRKQKKYEFINIYDEFSNTDEVDKTNVVSSSEQNEANSESNFDYIKDDKIECGTNIESNFNDSLNLPNSSGDCIANKNDCDILKNNSILKKSERTHNEASHKNNEITNNTLQISRYEIEDKSISKALPAGIEQNIQINHHSDIPSDFDFTDKDKISFVLPVLKKTPCVQPRSTTFNVKQNYDNTDDNKNYDYFKTMNNFQNMKLETEYTISTAERDEDNLIKHFGNFIKIDENAKQTESKHKGKRRIYDSFSKNICRNNSDGTKQRHAIDLNETCLKLQDYGNTGIQENKHISMTQNKILNLRSNKEWFPFDRNKKNECKKKFREEHFKQIPRDIECTSKAEIKNVINAWANKVEFEEDGNGIIHEMERNTDENIINEGKLENIISETDKELSLSKNNCIQSSVSANIEQISSNEDIWKDGIQATSNIYRRKTKLDSQSKELEILREFYLNLNDMNNEGSNVDDAKETSTKRVCEKSIYKCRKSISLPYHIDGESGCNLGRNYCSNKLNSYPHKDNSLMSNNIRTKILSNVPYLIESLKLLTSGDQIWPNLFHTEDENTINFTDITNSMSDEKSCGRSETFFIQHLFNNKNSELTNSCFPLSTKETMQKNSHTPFDKTHDSNSDLIKCLNDNEYDNRLSLSRTDNNQDEHLSKQSEYSNFSNDDKSNIIENSIKHVEKCTPIQNVGTNSTSMHETRNHGQSMIYNQTFDTEYNKSLKFESVKDIMDNGLHENKKYFSPDSKYDHKSLSKYSVSSLSSESSKLSDSGDAKEVDTNVKMSESFIISASGDNREASGKVIRNSEYFQTNHEKFHKENGYKKCKTTGETGKSISPASTEPCKVTINIKHKSDSAKKRDYCEHKNYIADSDLRIIEAKRLKSIEAFRRQKSQAMSGMRSNMRVIPIRRTEKFEFTFNDIENKYKFRNRIENAPKHLAHNSDISNIDGSTAFSVHSEIAGHQMSIKTSAGKIMFQTTVNGNKTDQIPIELSESESELFCSQTSINMTPVRKNILNASRAIRSPKYPIKVSHIHRKKSVIYSKGHLVAYVTKDEKNKCYHIRKGTRMCDVDSNNYKYKIVDSKKMRVISPDNRRNQAKHATTNRAKSPDDLRIKFDDNFKSYAGKGRMNGELISYKRSTEWLKDAGVVGKVLTTEEANDAFKATAGAKVALNRGDYRHFLNKLSRLKQLNYNNIYERLCSASNK